MAKKGSGLTIAQRPNGAWRAQIRKAGYPYQSKDFLTHEEADSWGLRRLSEIQTTGRLVDRRPAERTTLAQAIEDYITKVTLKRPSEASRVTEEARLRRFMRAERALCAHALAHLSHRHFEDWRDRRLTETVGRGKQGGRGQYKAEVMPAGRFRKDGQLRKNAAAPKAAPKPPKVVAAGTVKREMTMLKRIFDFAMKEYNLPANPLDNRLVDRPSVQDARDVRIDASEWGRLLDECRSLENTWVAPIVEIAREIGARRGSMLKLLWADVNLSKAHVTLRGVKNSRRPSEVRTVQIGLSPRAVEILDALPRSLDGRVFQITASAFTSSFKRARKRAGLEHFRLHDSRHEMASTLVEAGWEMLDVMRQGDWRDPKSVSRYYAARGAHLGAKLAKLSKS